MAVLVAAMLAVAAVPTSSASLINSPWTLPRRDGPLQAAFAAGFAPALPLALKAGVRATCPSAALAPSIFGVMRPQLKVAGSKVGAATLRPAFENKRLYAGALRMAAHDEDEEDFEDDQEEVLVTDEDTGKTIECYVDQDVTIDGKTYYIVYPCDTPVVIAYVDKEGDEEELVPVAEEDISRVFAGAYKACADIDCELADTAVVLTLQGYEDDTEEDEDDKLGDAGDDEEFVRVITSYEDNGVEYLITEPLEPVLIITKADTTKKSSGTARQSLVCLPEDELISVMPEVEKMLELRFQDLDLDE